MSDTIKVKDKITDEVITLRLKDSPNVKTDTQPSAKNETYAEEVANRRVAVREAIAKRGSLWGGISENVMSPNPIRKGIGILGVVGSPFNMLESGVSNIGLALQNKEYNPLVLAKEAALGFSGIKQGQYGDILRIAGVPEPVAAGTGLLLSVSPIKALQTINKTFGAVSKWSDKGVMNAGESLIKATQQATKTTGVALEKAYQPLNNIAVNNKVIKSLFDKMPTPLKEEILKTFSGVNFANPTVGVVRQIKQIIGKYKPSIFGKGERGVAENIEAAKIEKLYATTKQIINSAVESRMGKKAAELLSKTDDAFYNVSNASDYIQKAITDSTLKMATKGGNMAKKLAIDGDVSGRTALNILKKSGARKEITKAVDSLSAFNRWQAANKFAQHVFNAAIFGGAAGSVGGLIAQKMYGGGD